MVEHLASYRRTIERIRSNWQPFREKRAERLVQQQRHGVAAEKVAENILEDLLTLVLDWSLSDVNNQVGYADVLLTQLGIKYLLFETKRPGALAWHRGAVERALDQAVRYADEQKVRCVGVSDGVMLYAADIQHGGLQDRVFVSLDDPKPPEQLWWLAVDGVYRPRDERDDAALRLLPEEVVESPQPAGPAGEDLLHPKYKLPARCFAYVGDAADAKTWKLPYRVLEGDVDRRRISGAIRAIVSNYRGGKVSGIPEEAIPEVLVRLGRAATAIGKMPHQTGKAAAVYVQLAAVLEQFGRLEEVVS